MEVTELVPNVNSYYLIFTSSTSTTLPALGVQSMEKLQGKEQINPQAPLYTTTKGCNHEIVRTLVTHPKAEP